MSGYRPPPRFLRTAAGCTCILMWLSAPAFAVIRVELQIDEPLQGRSVPWPVTTGVPFPRDGLARAENCRLVDDTGRERLLQTRVAATWDAERTSIRWLTIDFIAEPGRSYVLEFGPDIERGRFESPLQIQDGELLNVQTGGLEAEFSKDSPAVLANLRVDLSGDGRITPEEAVAGDSEHYYLDHDGTRCSSRGDGDRRRIEVEAAGPVRACVRVDGFYTGPAGQRIVEYRTRYHFFAGLGLMKVVDEFRIVGSADGVRFADIGFSLAVPLAIQDRTISVDSSGDDGNQTLRVPWRPETESISSFQSVYRHYGNPEYHAAVVENHPGGEQRLAQTDRMGPWMQMADASSVVTGSLRWFWQQFPKEWQATTDRMVLHLWSPRGGQLDFSERGIREFFGPKGRDYLLDAYPQPPTAPTSRYMMNGTAESLKQHDSNGQGINKHHEFFLHFAPAGQAREAQEYAALAARQPIALASGEWNCKTDVFGPLAARPNDSKYEAIVDRLFDLGRYAQDAFGDYGWWLFGAGPHYSYQWDERVKRHFADPRRFEYHTYQKETQLWWCYLRSGERKFYDWAIPSENHWVDIAVSHQPLKFQSQWRGGEPEHRTLDWPVGDWSIDGAAHFLRHHETGEAWLRGGSQFWASYHRTLETSTLAYYLTGDERYNDVVSYWRAYFSDLAGKTSGSTDIKPWHRQQAWFEPTESGEPAKTWAEMIRDYAPFNSGSRHQLTLLFNLATLYEHTWDPKIGQALEEYAAAFLDPDHPIGVWRSQDNRLPASAEAPTMAHFWVPALWKYARATQDPRMNDIFQRYFEACYYADPFHEDVGSYSSVHIGYAYYFTRDPRHLRPALRELERLLPNSAPLANPRELGGRLYNPYVPIRSFTGVPRLIWALDAAKRDGVAIPEPEPLEPQRVPMAFKKTAGKAIEMTLWGFDDSTLLLGPDGKPPANIETSTQRHVSHLQPFDRTLRNYAVFTYKITIPADAPAGFYSLAPRLETAILRLRGAHALLCNASQPLAISPGQTWRVRAAGVEEPILESGQLGSLEIIEGRSAHEYRIENVGSRPAWFRIANWPEEQCWMTTGDELPQATPGREQTRAARSPVAQIDPDQQYVPGRFGKAVQIHSKRQLHIPDHVTHNGREIRLFDMQQGTLEFWVKILWDQRIQPVRSVTFLTNGFARVTNPGKLPTAEWAHVAVVWRPAKRDPSVTLVHVYVDGLDTTYYRSLWWPGYGNRPIQFSDQAKLLGAFVSRAPPGAVFALDELRVSATARYADLEVEFGNRQTFNPVRFDPPQKPFAPDEQTLLLLHFDGDLKSTAARHGATTEGRFAQ